MKNNYLTLLIVLLTLISCQAQAQAVVAIVEDLPKEPFDVTKWDTLDSTMIKVQYQRVVRDPMRKSGERREKFDLQVGQKVTKFYSHHIDAMDQRFSGLSDKGFKFIWFDGTSIFTNHPEGKMTVVEREYFSTIEESFAYKYEDDIPQMNWEITSDTLSILGHLCQKATTTFRGRVWNAWFAPELPLPIYPWKFNGLPGAILGFEDEDGIISARAIEITQVCEPIKWYKWRYEQTTREKIADYQRRVHNRPSLILQDGEPTMQVTSDGVMSVANSPIPYQPMELE